MSLYAVALRFPFTGTKGPSPNHCSSSTKLYICPYAFGQVAFSWHLPNPDLSVGLPDGESWFITPENAFPLLQSPMVVSFTPLQQTLGIGHGDLRLVCGYLAMETHFMKLHMNSSCADVASRGIFGTRYCMLQPIDRCDTRFSTRWSCSVSLCGLPLCGWAVVAPRCFHFTITAQKFDSLTCWKGGILWRCHIESHWALLEGHSNANVCLWSLILYTCQPNPLIGRGVHIQYFVYVMYISVYFGHVVYILVM